MAAAVGRFAPSPTHHLHLGSLTTAVASFCHIKSLGGQWLLRIEDVDFERCQDAYTMSILHDLERLGLHHDGEIVYQSERHKIYQAFIHDNLAPFSYACRCSRKDLAAYRAAHPIPHGLNTPIIYPRLCLGKSLSAAHPDSKIRLQLPAVHSAWLDEIQGIQWDNPALSLGDVVIKRQNQMINYILACAIDDGLQGISHVMRGLDVMPMTVAQLDIIKLCGLPPPSHFAHLPLLYNSDGQKLSKQNLAAPIDTTRPSELLLHALTLLGQPVEAAMADGTPAEILGYAVQHWDNQPLIGRGSLGVAG